MHMSANPVPFALLELQQWICQFVRRPLGQLGPNHLPLYDDRTRSEIEKKILPSAHLSAADCIGIYNQQYWFRLFTLAQENFPTLVRLFGYADFNQQLVEPAILKYPPDHWAIWKATLHLPRWIEESYEGEDKSFISQIAQIDAAYHTLSYSSLPSVIPCDGDLLKFREQLLEKEPEYWLSHEFPEIDFSQKIRVEVSLLSVAPQKFLQNSPVSS